MTAEVYFAHKKAFSEILNSNGGGVFETQQEALKILMNFSAHPAMKIICACMIAEGTLDEKYEKIEGMNGEEIEQIIDHYNTTFFFNEFLKLMNKLKDTIEQKPKQTKSKKLLN